MTALDDPKLQVLHSHYQDTCSGLQAFRSQRERLLYSISAVLVLVLYDSYAPQDFGGLLTDVLRSKVGLTNVPDLAYLSTLAFLILFGLVLRYCQAVVHIERQYKYLHKLEELLSSLYGGQAFTREGLFYLADYPLLSNWAHYLYTITFPILLLAVIVFRSAQAFRSPWPWDALVWVDSAIAFSSLITIILYLNVIHEWPKKSPHPAP